MKTAKKSLLFVSYIGFIVVAATNSALNVAWLYIQNDFGLPLSSLGLLITLPAATILIISFNSGRLVKWFGVGRFLLTGTILTMLGTLGYVLTPSWELMIAAAIVLGMGNAVLINGYNIFVASNYQASRVNWLHAFFGIGATLGPLLVTIVILDLGLSWRAAYAVIASLMLIMASLLTLTLQHWQLPTAPPDEKSKPVHTKGLFRSPIVWLTIGVMFFATGVEITTGQLSNSLFVDGRGFAPRAVATWISLYWFAYTIGRFITGTVIDRINHNLFLRVAMLLSIVGTALIWLNPHPDLNLVGLMIIGFAIGPIAPTIMGDTPHRVGVGRAPTVIGYQNTGASIGIAFFPSLAGIVAEAIGLEIVGLFLIFVAVTMFIVHELLNYQENLESRYGTIEPAID